MHIQYNDYIKEGVRIRIKVKMMKGYKALSQDMKAIRGNKMQFELGKEYTVDREVVPYKNGFHFCENIEFLDKFYDIKTSRIFEVEAYGNIADADCQYVAKNIRLIRELERQEIKDYFKQNWQRLVTSEDDDVRIAVAKHGYGLDTLVNDKNYLVRMAVAKHGYGLDVLVNDKNCFVKIAVIEQRYGLDTLANDENEVL